jgi:hypothetical protein
MELLTGIFSAFGLSASAGLNAYIPLLTIALIARYTDWFKLQAPFDVLTNPWIIILLGVLVLIEYLADSFPAINHLNDAIQTFIRPIAGAIVFAASAQVLTDVSPVLSLACGLLVAGGIHTVKAAAVRPAITATTGGTANPIVSAGENLLAAVTSFIAMALPFLIGIVLAGLAALLLWWGLRRINRPANV